MSTDKTQSSDDLSEEQIGNYKLIRLLGHGSFAYVYLAQDIRDTKRKVAIKILSVPLTDQKSQQRFIEEGKILLRLEHEHIVHVLERGIEKENPRLINTPFIVMSREGDNLSRLHLADPFVPPAQVVSYVFQLAKALDYAHAKKVIHRDVKPENILQVQEDADNPDSKGKIRLSDFNIAWRPEYDSGDGALGTPLYMAPEQWDGKPCRASDQYSLAIVAYEWLYGKRPFEGSYIELAAQHKAKLPPFEQDRIRNPVVPVAVERVLACALNKDPKARYGSVMDFAKDLEVATSLSKQNSQTTELPRIARRKFITIATISAVVAVPTAIATTEITLGLYSQPAKRKVAISGSVSTAHKALLPPYNKHNSKVSAVAWSPDGKRIASGGFDGEIRVWNLRGETLVQFNHSAKVLSIAWDPTGTYIVSVSADRKLRFWNATTEQIHYEYPDNSSMTAAWSARKDLVVGLGSKAGVFDTPIDHGFRLTDKFFTGHKDIVNALSFSPDSTKVASASDDYTVCLWDEDKGSLISPPYTGHKAQVLSVDWAPQPLDLIVSGGADRTVQIWIASQTKLYHSYLHNGSVLAVQWSPNGEYLVSGGSDAIAKLWKIGGGSITDYTEHSGSINGVAFSPDSRFVASASDDGTVRVWEV